MTGMTLREALRALRARPELPPRRIALLRERLAERVGREWIRVQRATVIVIALSLPLWQRRLWLGPGGELTEALALCAGSAALIVIVWIALPWLCRRRSLEQQGREIERARIFLPMLIVVWLGLGTLIAMGEHLGPGSRLAMVVAVAVAAVTASRLRGLGRWLDRDWMG